MDGCETGGDSVCQLYQQKHSGFVSKFLSKCLDREDLLSFGIISWLWFYLQEESALISEEAPSDFRSSLLISTMFSFNIKAVVFGQFV